MVPPLMVEGAEGRMYEALPERPRFLTLSDGQVLDRAKPVEHRPLSGVEIRAIRLANEGALNYKTLNPALLQST